MMLNKNSSKKFFVFDHPELLSNTKILLRFYGFGPNCEIDISMTRASMETFLRWL